MLDTLRAWLNGKKEYYTGVAIYSQVGDNKALLQVFEKGPTDFTTKRLGEELFDICIKLKAAQHELSSSSNTSISNLSQRAHRSDNTAARITADGARQAEDAFREGTASSLPPTNQIPQHQQTSAQIEQRSTEKSFTAPVNPVLYEACKLAADKQYKEVMNSRAVLFQLAKHEDFEDPNTPDRIKARAKLALEVVAGYQQASKLFDDADYVRIHGRLPNNPDDDEQNEYDLLPDHMVKQTLDNLRKNFNKIKKRDQTPARVAALQKHAINIKKLEARWLLLKPQA
jgi:hypothetical protein